MEVCFLYTVLLHQKNLIVPGIKYQVLEIKFNYMKKYSNIVTNMSMSYSLKSTVNKNKISGEFFLAHSYAALYFLKHAYLFLLYC